MSTVCCQFTLCGEASSKRLPGIIPAGYASQTGYQYDSISRVAGQREPAPPSNFSKLGGFKNNVFITDAIYYDPLRASQKTYELEPNSEALILLDFHSQPKPCFSRNVLLEHLRQLAGGLQQRQLAALAREIRIQKSHPLVALVKPAIFDIAQVGPALIELRLQELQAFLCELQIQPRDLPGGIEFQHIALFLQQVEANLLAFVPQGEFGGA